jgi:hypothetical protein
LRHTLRVDGLPDEIREAVLAESGAPNDIGSRLAKRYASRQSELLRFAIWTGTELSSSLFLSNPPEIVARVRSFEKSLLSGRKVRQRITLSNFVPMLKEMRQYFDPNQAVKTVRAFYSMVYSWSETSTVVLSERVNDQATLGGEVISNLIPSKRGQFKDFVENRAIRLADDENVDDFFARYDQALDAVDRDFRVKHGIYFTDLYLSKFVMWIVRQHLPDLGKNYLVIDPACGSGNLVTNWRSPLELRHKVVSEIEPELLFAVDRRMQGDAWHHGRFTVVPRATEGKGLNFLDRSAKDYLNKIAIYLNNKGLNPDKPLAFLCNPPYRSDDDQAAGSSGYEIDPSIAQLIGKDAGSERYCCFLAQMKLICEAAEESGLPGESLLLLFTKSAWLTKRSIFQQIRAEMLGNFEDIGGILVNGSEFFQIKGSWPVAFTMWRYKGKKARLEPERTIPLLDLTWLTRDRLASIRWNDEIDVEQECKKLYKDQRGVLVNLGEERVSIREWVGQTMLDFKRSRRKNESDQSCVGGLPKGDHRMENKKAYGEIDGRFIGFMDDLTPCRVRRSTPDRPWFRLNSQFMDAKKNRCFSGPPTHWGYCATDLEAAKKLFFWYSLARTFLQHPYPMWADAEDLWQPMIPIINEKSVFQTVFAIAYAENECLTTSFPADNPMLGVPELAIRNPMTPLDRQSFWSVTLQPFCASATSNNVFELVKAVDAVFAEWQLMFRHRSEIPVSTKSYLLGPNHLTIGAGIIQIRDYARDENSAVLQQRISEVQAKLKLVKTEFFELVVSRAGFSYFGSGKKMPSFEKDSNYVRKLAVG